MNNRLGSSNAAPGSGSGVKTEYVPDDRLVELIRIGSHEAFEILRGRHEKRLLKTAIHILRNREDGEDAVQESFLKAYRRIETFSGRSTVSTWLTRIVINTCLMQLRKQRTRPTVSLDEPNELGLSRCDGVPDRSINIEASYVGWERRKLLSIAVSRLKPSLRSVVDAYRQHDYTMAELAEQSGLSVPAAKSRLRRARQTLERSPVMNACR
ncbi:RNA polymerase sigma-70 factor (ECF subfamily) [Granulicella aggregans]|uniref:RNA polymerase sigma-70 factor (ECF subfamily) n=1 Tax=Granulicella aggregans TaxID=474949 RepID=A0A7W7ZHN2_9BACT|nr:RNA polymerase sigma-70 factor (ECF subfamily) [Granulicella aggregans]